MMIPHNISERRSKVDGVKLQATSGILLAISNGLGPAQLAPRIGTRGTVET